MMVSTLTLSLVVLLAVRHSSRRPRTLRLTLSDSILPATGDEPGSCGGGSSFVQVTTKRVISPAMFINKFPR